MSTKIYKDVHLNMDAYIIENDKLRIKILEEFGGKIASIYHKDSDLELLFQPTKGKYKKPKLKEPFENYDTSGIDEMLPTIDSCFYPNSYRKLNDHGDIWAQKWDYEIDGDSLITKVRCDSIKLDFIRKISLEDEDIVLDYKLINPTDQDLYYLWAFHGLFNFDESTELEFPFEKEIINVVDKEDYDFDFKKLSEYPDGKSFKFYFDGEIPKGEASFIRKDKNIKVDYKFDTDINKYLGVWITKGGFKGEYNLAIEPTSGFYDSLEKAFKNDRVSKIDSKDKLEWYLKISVKKWR